MKILTVVGARPQFIKAATVSRCIKNTPGIEEYLLHTGQHYDANMSEIFFDELDIPKPDLNLEIGSGLHGAQTGEMLSAIENSLLSVKPDWLLVYGDTNSTLAGALAAAKLHIPVAHVEAGLRSFNKNMPEEVNRILTDHCSDLLLTPTKLASMQLEKEGIAATQVCYTGDVMFDAARYYAKKATEKSQIVSDLGLGEKKFFLATIHRAENTDDPKRLKRIISELSDIAKLQPVVLPLHPRTQSKFETLGIDHSSLTVIEPVGYLDMVQLESNASVIVTDSGGVQKEAFFHSTPCITLRTETEWVELVECGCNTLFPPLETNSGSLRQVVTELKELTPDIFEQPFYGDANAAEKIVAKLMGV